MTLLRRLRTLLPLSAITTLTLLATFVGFLLLERAEVNASIEELSRTQASKGRARELSLYVQYNAHDTNAYTLGHLEHRQEYVEHGEQFRWTLSRIERDLPRSALDPKTKLALDSIRPARERYERASRRLFRAADQNRSPTPKGQKLEDAAWETTDKLGDQLDERSQTLALALATKAQAQQAGLDARNDRIVLIVLAVGLVVGLLIMLIQYKVASAKAAAESSRRRAEELLRQNELILNSAGEGIHGLDREGRTTFANPAAARMTGHEVEELIGQRSHELVHHSRPDGTPFPVEECPVSKSLAEATVQHSDADDVYWRKDGTSFPVEYTSTPIVEGGQAKGAVVVFKDITERREAERTKDEFTSVVSHELRTPLTSIRGSLGLLESGVLGPLPEKGQRMVEVAVENTDRLVRLINDILDIERIDSGKIDMRPERCEAEDLIERALQAVQQVAAEAEVTLTPKAEPVTLSADPDRVLQTLTNLISNAVKFSPPGGAVHVSSARRDGEVLFQITDEGRGIPADKLASIFERFQQVDASDAREKGGTGLGLAICRTIVERHGGRIWVESVPGEGSTFSFVLPALAERERAPGDRAVPGGPAVLVCDDDASVVEVVGAMLAERGYRVIEAASGEQALARALSERPDAILLDLLMPGVSGWETAAALGERPETSAIPIVILSVLSEEEAETPSAPVADWLEKPVDERALFEALERAVGARTEPFKVLVVEDDRDLAGILTAIFESHGIETFAASSGRQAIELSQRVLPDLLVLEHRPAGGRRLRGRRLASPPRAPERAADGRLHRERPRRGRPRALAARAHDRVPDQGPDQPRGLRAARDGADRPPDPGPDTGARR